MEYSRKKLSKDSINDLVKVRIDSVQPLALMLSPVYIFLQENEKFVSVKAPLDFFMPGELKRLSVYEYFYFPKFVLSVLPFREAGQQVKQILSRKPENARTLPLPPYIISDLVLRIVGPLWWEYPPEGAGVEPFLVAIFVNELCDLIPSEKLFLVREKRDSKTFEKAILQSSWAVFLAVHLGYCNLGFLNRLRIRIFDEIVKGKDPVPSEELATGEVQDLLALAENTFKDGEIRLLRSLQFKDQNKKIFQKLEFRLERIVNELLSKGERPPTIYGEWGFVDV